MSNVVYTQEEIIALHKQIIDLRKAVALLGRDVRDLVEQYAPPGRNVMNSVSMEVNRNPIAAAAVRGEVKE
jgi:hypothetical protein